MALDAAQIGKQNAETEAAMAKERVASLKSEIKQIELTVSVWLNSAYCIIIIAKFILYMSYRIDFIVNYEIYVFCELKWLESDGNG